MDGKFLSFDGKRFPVRGVTYGTFAEGEFGLFPERERIRRDFAAMAEAGVNTVRVYTVPEPEVLDFAEEASLKLLMGMWWEDPLYHARPTGDAWKEMASDARSLARRVVKDHAGHPALLGFVLGNEIPSPLVRWHGRRKVEGLLRSLYETGREVAPDALFSYANYPSTGYLDTGYLDFDCFNVFLEDESAYRRYLSQLQLDAGERPLILTELGLDSASHGEGRQAEILDWQLRLAAERGIAGACVFSWTDEWWVAGNKIEDWSFGVTREDREPKPALEVVSEYYRKNVPDHRERWPRVSVVVCAYNAGETIGECLESLGSLNYPDYEVLVVDDGSTDDTAEVAGEFPVRVISGGRLGLSGARNLGIENASGEIVAYIDADARADPDWLTYLALALEAPDAAGAGGPNVVPPDDPPVAQCVARSPGRPVHVLLDNERAEHVPGCNMAFWKEKLGEVSGFDPVYRAAGDDADVCWKLQDRGYDIRFHPSALVWHRHRSTVRGYWKQQSGYGRAEALVARSHPDKFNSLGHAIWRGVIYAPTSFLPRRYRIYYGYLGDAAYQRIYRERSNLKTITILYLLLGLFVLSVLDLHLMWLPVSILLTLMAAFVVQGVKVAKRKKLEPAWKMGAVIGLLSFLQPIARELGRLRARGLPFSGNGLPMPEPSVPALKRIEQNLFAAEEVDDRQGFIERLRDKLLKKGLRTRTSLEWERADLICNSTFFWRARLVSFVQHGVLYLGITRKLRYWRLAVPALIVFLVGMWPPNMVAWTANFGSDGRIFWSPELAAAAAVVFAALVLAEWWFFGRRLERALTAEPEGAFREGSGGRIE
ncbi:MAG: glycosyltransferase [Rubrobacteraceae bacterium]